MSNRGRSPTGRRDGTAAVELAIVLPTLLLLVFGCVDFGRVAYFSMALRNAVGAGSDYAATHRFTDYTVETWERRVRERVTEEMQDVPEFDDAALNVQIATETDVDGNVQVSVAATYPFQTVVDWPGLPSDITLNHQVSAWQYR